MVDFWVFGVLINWVVCLAIVAGHRQLCILQERFLMNGKLMTFLCWQDVLYSKLQFGLILFAVSLYTPVF